MIVEKLIEKLQEMDPTARVLLEMSDTECAPIHEAIDDDNGRFVLLTPGEERIPLEEEP